MKCSAGVEGCTITMMHGHITDETLGASGTYRVGELTDADPNAPDVSFEGDKITIHRNEVQGMSETTKILLGIVIGLALGIVLMLLFARSRWFL